ncbi:MAG: polysaccharide biosynthesis/export family protein [Paracoccaceae bacterium]
MLQKYSDAGCAGLCAGFLATLARLALCATFGLLAAAGSAAAQEDDGLYRLGAGDQIEITILEDPSLNRQVLILPDGRISLPIAGTMKAAGSTPEQLAAQVRSRLSSIFVTPPTVTVSALGLAEGSEEEDEPELVFVIGEVNSPGAVRLSRPMTVLQSLAMAGGPGPFAARSRIQIHREADGVTTVETFNYEAVEDGTAATAGPVLTDGDIIVVPERSLFD